MTHKLAKYPTKRLREVLAFITENDNGDVATLAVDILAEIANRSETYRLGSSAFVNTVGFMRTLLHAYDVPSDRQWSVKTLTEGWGLSKPAAIAVLSKAVPYKIEGDVVVFTFEREEA